MVYNAKKNEKKNYVKINVHSFKNTRGHIERRSRRTKKKVEK